MSTIRENYIEDPQKFRRILWDYDISPREFFSILDEKGKSGWLSRDWAIARLLEHAPYYDAIALVPLDTIRERWEQIKPKLFNKTIQKGYDYVLRRHALSPAG